MRCVTLVEIGPVVWGKNLKWKVYNNNKDDFDTCSYHDNNRHKKQILIRTATWAFGSGKLKCNEILVESADVGYKN